MTGSVDYHLRELEAARNRDDPRHCLPNIAAGERDVLDIGCGIGQFFIAQGRERTAHLSAGLDIDQEALAYGARHFPDIDFVRGKAESLPFARFSFDLVVSRVSLPYTDLPRALDEIARVLRPGGRIWLSLHPLARTWHELGDALRHARAKDVVFRAYSLLNGCLLHAFGCVLPFPLNGRYESFQTSAGMRRLLAMRNFEDVGIRRDRHFVVSARRPIPGS